MSEHTGPLRLLSCWSAFSRAGKIGSFAAAFTALAAKQRYEGSVEGVEGSLHLADIGKRAGKGADTLWQADPVDARLAEALKAAGAMLVEVYAVLDILEGTKDDDDSDHCGAKLARAVTHGLDAIEIAKHAAKTIATGEVDLEPPIETMLDWVNRVLAQRKTHTGKRIADLKQEESDGDLEDLLFAPARAHQRRPRVRPRVESTAC